ncbi:MULTISPECIES: N-acetylmuramoyl-L-alanine amidase [unclassified Apibacter]|uniref:N-acetylmuramoyl-L-alanine amidase n=1 Tax=unclassified Apibacter TaxID=2630820 RepID=UPI00135DF875|nr:MULTISPECIES: N-acetylmuramoyl-L-alanine amidase [unclassified Apibacter]MXP05459.1 lysozyme [Apibacter sp. B3546]MXP12424.1 lysozyme [Apibacter sp. B3239]
MNLKKSIRTIKYLVIHCAATPEGRNDKAKDIDRWHKERGWTGIGYNYVIDLDGTVEPGRDVDRIPAQVAGHNKNAIGICYIGGADKNLKAKDTRNPAQKKSLIELLKELRKLYPTAQILGHRDFASANTTCPSFDAIEEYKNI